MQAEGKAKMKAVVLKGPGDFCVEDIPIPEPGIDEVLCAVEAVAICGSDPKFIRGDTKGVWPPSYPFVIGHEWAGRVVAVGPNVAGYKPGDRVAGEAHNGCGYCGSCKAGNYNLCENYGNKEAGHRHYGHSSTGCYAQYGVFSKRSLTRLPGSVSYEEGAIVDAAGTGLHAVELTGITPGGSVVVIGPGPIGIITAKLARAMGSARVIVVGRGERLVIAGKLCADYTVDFEKEDVVAALRRLTDMKGADEIFECSGSPGTANQAVKAAKKNGKVALLGIPSPGSIAEIDDRALVLNQITLYGSRANPNVSAKLLSMIASGRLQVKDLITHRFSIDEFATALDYFVRRRDGAMKVIVEPQR